MLQNFNLLTFLAFNLTFVVKLCISSGIVIALTVGVHHEKTFRAAKVEVKAYIVHKRYTY